MEETIFHKILEREVPASIVYEDNKCVAFLDISPINKGHTLVVPKNYSRNVRDVSEEDLFACIKVANRIGKSLMESLGADGYNIVTNVESAAGQAVFYTHFHVIPRFNNDGLKNWPSKEYEGGEMEEIKEKIRKFI